MIIFSALILIYITAGAVSDSPCGEWEKYEEDKCLKIFDAAGLVDYASAENFCKEQDGSSLLSIDVEEKQKFVEKFLKSNSVVDNVWLGLKYVDKTYQWADGTKYRFKNWEISSMKNSTGYCVQLETETSNFGLWSSESCSKKNLVICEKTQVWSLAKLQSVVMKLVKEDTVPIGFIYMQLFGQDEPTVVWPGTEWENVSPQYAGLFFRVEGGDAAGFEEKEPQEADSPRLVGMRIITSHDDKPEITVEANDLYDEVLSIDGSLQHTGWELQAKVSKAEVRPRNRAVRIWKRTK